MYIYIYVYMYIYMYMYIYVYICIINRQINTRGNWENSKLYENTPPSGRHVSTQTVLSTRKMFYIC